MRTLLLAGLSLAAGASFGQTVFAEKKGVQEFTGRMIVRPFTPSELAAKGMTPETARRKALEAWLTIEKLVVRQDVEVGEAVVRVPSSKNENSFSSELMKTGLFSYASPDWLVFPTATPNDPQFSRQWHHTVMQSPRGWDLHTGTSVMVGICDTGVETSHPDLQPLLRPGYNSPDDKRQVDGGVVEDIHGHGTHVAGCAAARGNNGQGVAGVGWNFRILPVRVTNSPGGGAATSDLNRGVRWCADNGAKVINLSYSGISDPTRETTGAYARTKGAIFVNGAGNDNADLASFDWPNVVVVGASDSADKKAGFSAYGKAIDCFAPGVGILSSVMGKGYAEASGTSMAGPVAAGLLALIWSYAPALTPAKVEEILYATCDNIGSSGVFGAGRINVGKAMELTKTYLTSKVVFTPSVLAHMLGTYRSGTTSSLLAADGDRYVVNSAGQPRIGHAAALSGTFRLGSPSSVTSFELECIARTSSGQSTTLSLFLTNRTTGKDDLITSTPLTTFDSKITFTVGSSSLAKYLSSTGEVKATVRGYAADSRLGGPAGAFQLGVDRFVVLADLKS